MIRFTRTVCFSIALAASFSPISAQACSIAAADAPVVSKQFFPYAELSTRHWPQSYTVPMGGLVSFLAPKGTALKLRALAKGTSDAVVRVDEKQVDAARNAQRIRLVDGDQPVAFNPQKYQWVHVFAASYGKSEVLLTGPRGWQHRMDIGVVYPSAEEAVGRSPLFAELPADETPSLRVDGYDSIVLSLPGEMADQWALVDESGASIGFKLTRIEAQEVPFNDPPRVKLLLSGTRSPASGMASIRRMGATGETALYRFKVVALPTASC